MDETVDLLGDTIEQSPLALPVHALRGSLGGHYHSLPMPAAAVTVPSGARDTKPPAPRCEKTRYALRDRRRSREWHHFRYVVDTATDNVSTTQVEGPLSYVVDTPKRAGDKSQGRQSTQNGNHGQRHPRLRHRQAAD